MCSKRSFKALDKEFISLPKNVTGAMKKKGDLVRGEEKNPFCNEKIPVKLAIFSGLLLTVRHWSP